MSDPPQSVILPFSSTMTSSSERLLLALVLGAAVAVCGVYCSKLVERQRYGRHKSLGAMRLAAAPRVSMQELQKSRHWVALCGTAFDVAGVPFFDAARAGIYGSWVGHDVTYLLLQLGLTPDAADDAVAVASYLDREWPLHELQGGGENDEDVKRRRGLVKEWFVRFHSRYEVVAQLTDRYVGAQWDALREEMLPPDSGASSGGKCPLGFGARTVAKVVSRSAEDVKGLRTIMFQGRWYDVTDSSLFHTDGGQFAHFVGHDITYAMAVQSMRVEDLDVIPERAYTFKEQLLLEKYRSFFARELTVLEVESMKEEDTSEKEMINLHQFIEESDSVPQEECALRMEKALENASAEHVNEVCTRTTMTPLHKAVEKHRLDLVKVLVVAGADINSRAALYDDETPLEMAHRFHFDDIVAHLGSVAVASN